MNKDLKEVKILMLGEREFKKLLLSKFLQKHFKIYLSYAC
jgi:hypothetical protein